MLAYSSIYGTFFFLKNYFGKFLYWYLYFQWIWSRKKCSDRKKAPGLLLRFYGVILGYKSAVIIAHSQGFIFFYYSLVLQGIMVFRLGRNLSLLIFLFFYNKHFSKVVRQLLNFGKMVLMLLNCFLFRSGQNLASFSLTIIQTQKILLILFPKSVQF